MATWEYKIMDLPMKTDSNLNVLNQLGKDGWELIAVTTQTRASNPTAYFKRQTGTTTTGTGSTGTTTGSGTGTTTGTTTTNPLISIGLK